MPEVNMPTPEEGFVIEDILSNDEPLFVPYEGDQSHNLADKESLPSVDEEARWVMKGISNRLDLLNSIVEARRGAVERGARKAS